MNSDGKESACSAGELGSQSLGQEDPLEKGKGILSSILAWRIPWIQEPGRLQSMTSHRVGHNWVTNTFAFIFHLMIHYISFFICNFDLSPLPFSPLMSLANGLQILFIFSKNQLLVSLIFYIVFFAPSVSHSCPLHLPRRLSRSSRYMWPSLLWSHWFSLVHIFPVHTGHCALQEWNFCFPQSCGVPVIKPCWSSKPNVLEAPPSDARVPSWRAWRAAWNSCRRTSVI